MKLFKKQNKARNPVYSPTAKTSKYAYRNKRMESVNQTGRKTNKDRELNNSRLKIAPENLKNIPALIVLLVILCSVLYFSTLSSNVKVEVLNTNKNVFLRDQTSYQQLANEFIKQSIFNRSKITFDSKGLSEKLKTDFPEIASVDVVLPLVSRQTVIKLQMSKPSFVLESNNEHFLISNNGVALIKLQDTKDITDLGLVTVKDQSTLNIELGKSAVPKDQVQFISTVLEQLEKQNFKVESLIIPTNLYDLNIKLEGLNYFLKFNILEDPKQQVGSFIALKQHLDQQGQAPNEYIDLRLGERVFYK